MTSNYIKEKKAAMTWTMYVMEAVGRAKRTGPIVTLHVGKEQSAMVLQEALLSLAFEWRRCRLECSHTNTYGTLMKPLPHVTKKILNADYVQLTWSI